jgi:outer membrane protein assembly factor BamB
MMGNHAFKHQRAAPCFCVEAASIIMAALLFSATNSSAGSAPGTILWKYDAGGTIHSSAAVAADGTVYLSAAGWLFAITNAGAFGSNKWALPAPLAGGISVTLGKDGTLYFGLGFQTVDCTLYAFNANGSQRWAFSFQPDAPYQSTFKSTPAIGLDNTVYFVAGPRLFAVTADGHKKWDFPVDYSSVSPLSPVIGPDGTIFVGSLTARNLYAFTPDGTNKWTIPGLGGAESPAIGASGTVYYASGKLYAFSQDGTQLWATGEGLDLSSPVVVGLDGSLYVGNVGRHLYAFTASGQLLWDKLNSFSFYFGNYTAAAVDAGGNICYCISNSIWGLSPQGQVQWQVGGTPPLPSNGDMANTSPTIGPDGTIYASVDSTLYAIASGTNGPAKSSWPMYQQNAQHTGKIEKPTLQQPKKRADGGFQLQVMSQIDQPFTVQTSMDLVNWLDFTNMVCTNVPMDVIDPSPPASAKFYRAYSH